MGPYNKLIFLIALMLLGISANFCFSEKGGVTNVNNSNKGVKTMDNSWKTELVEVALKKYLPVFTKGMSPDDIEKSKKVYSIIFYYSYTNDQKTPFYDESFNEFINEKVTAVTNMPLEQRILLLKEDSLRSELEPLNAFAEITAIDVLNGQPVSAELRKKTEEVKKQLHELIIRQEKDFPHLSEEFSHYISESMVDCDYILSEGKKPAMSRRLYHVYRRINNID